LGDYSAWGIRFRVVFESDNQLISISLNSLTITVDMPDRFISGDDIPCAVGGTAVSFDPPFKAKPTVVVDGQSLPSGARSVRSATTRAGFTIQFFDSVDVPIAASFDFTAAGYSRDNS
jgi:hypothetical protein